jgi:single-strand DNA-binding protein
MQFFGNVGRDPELRTTMSGKMVTEVAVAVKQRGKKDENGNWVDQPAFWTRVELWNRQAENAADTLRKGDRVYVTGNVEQEVFTKRDGTQGTSLRIVYGSIEKVDREQQTSAPSPQQTQAPAPQPARVVVTTVDGDDIPF